LHKRNTRPDEDVVMGNADASADKSKLRSGMSFHA
jgi:hypothetical protein